MSASQLQELANATGPDPGPQDCLAFVLQLFFLDRFLSRLFPLLVNFNNVFSESDLLVARIKVTGLHG